MVLHPKLSLVILFGIFAFGIVPRYEKKENGGARVVLQGHQDPHVRIVKPLYGLANTPREFMARRREHVEKLAKVHGVSPKRTASIVDDVRAALSDWTSYARDAGVGISMAPVSEGLGLVAQEYG